MAWVLCENLSERQMNKNRVVKQHGWKQM